MTPGNEIVKKKEEKKKLLNVRLICQRRTALVFRLLRTEVILMFQVLTGY
jgi:hypothetical protein